MIQAARIIGIGLATTGLIGAGVGIKVVLGILGVIAIIGFSFALAFSCRSYLLFVYPNITKYLGETLLLVVLVVFFAFSISVLSYLILHAVGL